jgi:hypothetical protein
MTETLASVLRRKFGTPKAVLRALGLDETLLASAREEALKLAQDAARARDDQPVHRTDGSAVLANDPSAKAAREKFGDDDMQVTGPLMEKVARMLREGGVDSNLIKHVIYALADGAEDDAPGESLSERDRAELRDRTQMSAADRVRGLLRDGGLSADDIKTVMDNWPKSALNGGMGGKFSEKNGMAGDAALRRVSKRFPGIEHIGADSNFGVRVPERTQPAPTARRLANFENRFPDAARIVVGS